MRSLPLRLPSLIQKQPLTCEIPHTQKEPGPPESAQTTLALPTYPSCGHLYMTKGLCIPML